MTAARCGGSVLWTTKSNLREQTVLDKFHGFVVDFVIRALCELGQQIDDKLFDLR